MQQRGKGWGELKVPKQNRKGKRHRESLREEQKDNTLSKEKPRSNACATHSCGGGDLLRYNLQCIDHGDVSQASGDG